MNKLMLMSLLVVLGTASAQASENATEIKLQCVVPNEAGNPTIFAEIVVTSEASVDFMAVTLSEDSNNPDIYFTQTSKGAITGPLSTTGFGGIIRREDANVRADGVITGIGVINLEPYAGHKGAYEGLILAKGNAYPLACAQQ